jgi:hypothetical protein
LIKLLGNSLACTGVGWLLAFCISHGNMASDRAPREQKYTEFLAVKVLWFDAFYWTISLATSVYKLLPERFVAHPTQGKLTFNQIIVKLAPPMLLFVLGVTFLSVGSAVGVAGLPQSVRKIKLDLYRSFICCAFFAAAVDTQTRHIYKNETVAGQKVAFKLNHSVLRHLVAAVEVLQLHNTFTYCAKVYRFVCRLSSLLPTRMLSAPSRCDRSGASRLSLWRASGSRPSSKRSSSAI